MQYFKRRFHVVDFATWARRCIDCILCMRLKVQKRLEYSAMHESRCIVSHYQVIFLVTKILETQTLLQLTDVKKYRENQEILW
jgi:hypothetical protein